MKDNTIIILFMILFCFSLFLLVLVLKIDKGSYDYCVEWSGLNDGKLKRSNLIYTCYSLATNTFFCDYEIRDDGSLMIQPILNITKEEGMITEIVYDEPNYFNCSRWLKSR